MRYKIINDAAERTYALVPDTGDEAISELQRFAEQQQLTACRFTAIGAFGSALLDPCSVREFRA